MCDFLGNAQFSVHWEPHMNQETVLSKLFEVFYHREGILFLQRRRRTKEQKKEDQIEVCDVMGVLADHGRDAYDKVIVYKTHYLDDEGEMQECEHMEADKYIDREFFEKEIFGKQDIWKKVMAFK